MDIVDSHDLFKNQWRKRKTFYKKENYKIIYTISTDYTTDYSKWTLIYNPNSKDSRECKPKKKKTISIKSNSSSEKSITNESESEDENDEPEPSSKKASKISDDICFLKIK